tara:strand:+ start:857 stop:1504 length:648 start_codon:yes stop_codon:yes gene_type:complete
MSGILQIVGQASGVSSLLSVDSSGRAVVRDADSITQTTAVNTKLTAIDAVLDNSLVQQTAVNTNLVANAVVLANSLTQQTSVNSNLAILEVSNQAIKTAVEGTLAVSAPTITTSISSLAVAVSVADSATQTTASVDLGGVRTCAVFGSLSDGSANIRVEVSADDSVFYENSEQTIYISGTDYYKQMTIDARYIRLSYTNGSGVAQTWNAILSRKA